MQFITKISLITGGVIIQQTNNGNNGNNECTQLVGILFLDLTKKPQFEPTYIGLHD